MKKEEELNNILNKYKKKLKGQIDVSDINFYTPSLGFSREYLKFREEALTRDVRLYEKFCNFAEKIIKIRPKNIDEIKKSIEVAHLNISPTGASSFASFFVFLIILLSVFYVSLVYFFTGELTLSFFPIFLVIAALISLKPLSNIPIYIAAKTRLRASNQMVLCILYTVMYMRHTSNLERAVKFASDHLNEPLSLDLRKVFWDVETDKYTNIKESLDHYLESWRGINNEFIESIHIIEGSLYEPTEARRIQLLEKGLDIILEGTYERMLHYAHNLTSPITVLHMLGVILPILGLVIFPLLGAFLSGLVKWYHLSILYNVLLPIVVFSIGMNILSKRPTGYGEIEIPKIKLKPTINPKLAAFFVGFVFLFIGFLPITLNILNPEYDIAIGKLGNFFGYQLINNVYYGPFGFGSLALSLLIPLGLAFAIATYFKLNTFQLIKIRNYTKELEKEFSGSLFQLGNRIGDGIPAELAFSNVAENMKGTESGKFFRLVSINLTEFGMDLKEAIFNKDRGAILKYPSSLIASSMKVLIESSKKGPQVVAKSLISISEYVNRIHKVNERVIDLLADIISSMKTQIKFLTPSIAAIVVGVSSMIVVLISQLGKHFEKFGGAEGSALGVGNLGALIEIFKIQDVIPSFHFQVVVGLYVLEIVYILTVLSNGIEFGFDKVNERYTLSKNLYKTLLIYTIVALIVSFIFSLLAGSIIPTTITSSGF